MKKTSKEALNYPGNAQWEPDAAIALGWPGRRDSSSSELP